MPLGCPFKPGLLRLCGPLSSQPLRSICPLQEEVRVRNRKTTSHTHPRSTARPGAPWAKPADWLLGKITCLPSCAWNNEASSVLSMEPQAARGSTYGGCQRSSVCPLAQPPRARASPHVAAAYCSRPPEHCMRHKGDSDGLELYPLSPGLTSVQ